ncbi:MAG TPA: hypothetical protein VGH38_16480 [Bryobacteraceae bacterium]
MPTAAGERRRIPPGTYAVFLVLCALVVFSSHLPLIGLPYYWDEIGQFIPAALDILHGGSIFDSKSWIPHSTVPNIHPPAVMGYLAAVWSVAGFHPVATRCAMLLLASGALFAAFLLAIELSRGLRGMPALAAAGLLAVSPLFFAQAMLAQLDAPAMLFTTLALLFFLQDRIRLSAAVCVALVLVKETGLVAPLVFALWLTHEKRWRDARYFVAPAVVLAAWIVVLALRTGHWTGNADFVRYNVYEPLHPAHLAATLLRRLYFLLIADFHWVGAAAMWIAWRRSGLFRTREWKVAWLLVAAHVVAFTLLGGAVLERYLLPAMPILYIGMAAGLWQLGRVPKLAGTAILLAGLAAGNFVNPPYPFPLEDNLAFTDFIKLHATVADFLEQQYPGARVDTTWPLTAELEQPKFGYVSRGLAVRLLPDLTPRTLETIDWKWVQVLVAYSRDVPWQPLWQRISSYAPAATREQLRAHVPFPAAASFERHGQWVEVYVNPVGPPGREQRWERRKRVRLNAPAATRELRARVPFPAAASFERPGQWVEVYVNPVGAARP